LKDYLGDGVYVEATGVDIRLYTSDGVYEENSIYLDDVVYAKLVRFVERVKNARSKN